MSTSTNQCTHFTYDLWNKAWEEIGRDCRLNPRQPAYLYGQLHDMLSAKSRHYHCLKHIDNCTESWLLVMQSNPNAFKRPYLALLALFMHDAIYDVHRQDNEERSAQLAREWLLQVYPGIWRPVYSYICELIMATTHQSLSTRNDAQIVCDIDLASLASPRDEFQRLTWEIRKEWPHVEEEEFIRGRVDFFKKFLSSRNGRVFQSPYFEPFNTAALANITGFIDNYDRA